MTIASERCYWYKWRQRLEAIVIVIVNERYPHSIMVVGILNEELLQWWEVPTFVMLAPLTEL